MKERNKMYLLQYAEASAFLEHYPKVLKALREQDGREHAESMMRALGNDAVIERLKRGELTDEENVEPQAPISLGELEAQGLSEPRDWRKVKAAAWIYVTQAS